MLTAVTHVETRRRLVHVTWTPWVAIATCLSFLSPSLAGKLEEKVQQHLRALSNATEDEASEIIRELGRIGPEAKSAAPTLMRLLEQDHFHFEVADALTAMGPESASTIRNGLTHDKTFVRYWTLWAIANMRQDAEAFTPEVVKLTEDPDDEVRRQALKTLGQVRLPLTTTVPALAEILVSEVNSYDAAMAADALGEMGPTAAEAIPHLLKAARDHRDAYVRCRAIGALAVVDEMGTSASLAMSKGLGDTDHYGSQFAISVQRVASQNLALIAWKGIEPIPALMELLNSREIRDDPFQYEDISHTLAALGVEDAITVFQRDLNYQMPIKAPDPDAVGPRWFFPGVVVPPSHQATCIRVCAAAALARLDEDNQEAIDYLQRVLADDQWAAVAQPGIKGAQMMDPRAIAAAGLGWLDSRASATLPALRQAMHKGTKEQVDLGVKAAWAIARIDPKDRSCLATLRGGLHPNPQLASSPFHRQSPASIAETLGERFDDLLPTLVQRAFAYGAYSRELYIDTLVHGGDLAVNSLVAQALNMIEKSEEHYGYTLPRSRVVLDAIGARAEPAIDRLTTALHSKHHLVRAEAARMLGVIGKNPTTVIPLLRARLNDTRVLVRVRAAQALGRFGREANRAKNELHGLLDDEYKWCQVAAANAIARIPDAATLPKVSK